MNPVIIAAFIDLVAAAALGVSLVLLIFFVINRKLEFARLGQVPRSPFMVGDVLLLAALLVSVRAFNHPLLSSVLPLLAICGVILTYQIRGVPAFIYWRLELREIFAYFKTGFKFYLTIILPLILIAAAVMLVCRHFGVKFTQPQVELFVQLKSPGQIITFLLFAVIIAPLWEEMLFRGALYPFLKKFMPFGWAMLLSSLVWAIIHLHWPVILPFTFLGCALCFVYEQTGKLGNAIAVHVIFNLTSSLLLLFLKHYGNWQAF